MRVVSQDKKMSVPYDKNSFFVVTEELAEGNNFHIALRTPDFRSYFPLATYKDEVRAMNVFNDMIAAGERCMIPNGTFDFPT